MEVFDTTFFDFDDDVEDISVVDLEGGFNVFLSNKNDPKLIDEIEKHGSFYINKDEGKRNVRFETIVLDVYVALFRKYAGTYKLLPTAVSTWV